jgi:hypothetical protein
MNIFTKQAQIYGQIQAALRNAPELTAYNKFFQKSVDLTEYLPALTFYLKVDQSVNNQDQGSMGNHLRQITITCIISINVDWNEPLEVVADNVYSILYDWNELMGSVYDVQEVCNPSLDYQFDPDTNKVLCAELDIQVVYGV